MTCDECNGDGWIVAENDGRYTACPNGCHPTTSVNRSTYVHTKPSVTREQGLARVEEARRLLRERRPRDLALAASQE